MQNYILRISSAFSLRMGGFLPIYDDSWSKSANLNTMKYLLIVLINVFVFYVIRIASVLIAFGFGIGASASSSKYEMPLALFDIFLQVLFVIVVGVKKKEIFNKLHLIVALIVVFILGTLAFQEVIP
ncbi:hypothetical protein EYV94_18365 [Puteibacter caeruleilacunae]|nr:hypothetical protein EYV94_18365 [Puteibacter caeruleilacunae]